MRIPKISSDGKFAATRDREGQTRLAHPLCANLRTRIGTTMMDRLATVTSIDGTTIGYQVRGNGPGILVVHGNASSHEDFLPVSELLCEKFTVYLMDRRGRGLSGPQGADYSLASELEDVEAILSDTHCEFLFGHSFGAIVSIEVARRYPLEKLALYEPPIQIKPIIDRILPPFREALHSEDYKKAYMTLVGGLEVMTVDDKFEWYLDNVIKTDPVAWGRLVQLMKATEKEAIAAANNDVRANPSPITAEALLLLGDQSPAFIQSSAKYLLEVFPNVKLAELKGQGHTAQATAPEMLATALASFFS